MTETAVVNPVEGLPEGTEHLSGNLFLVPIDQIELPDIPAAIDELDAIDELFNTRNLDDSNKGLGQGCSKAEMEELMLGIQNCGIGVQNPPVLYRDKDGDKTSLIVAIGGRRFRALTKLVERNSKCIDPSDGVRRPASEVYSKIQVRIAPEWMSLEEVLDAQITENATHMGVGELADIRLHKLMRKLNWDDQKILDVRKKKTTKWLARMDFFASLEDDENTNYIFDALCKGICNFEAAESIASIEDVEQRRKVFDLAFAYAGDDARVKLKKLEKAVERAERNKDEAVSNRVLAEEQGTEEEKEAAIQAEEVAVAKLENQKNRKAKATKTPTIKSVHVKKAAKKKRAKTNNNTPRAVSRSKMEKKWLPSIDEWLKNNGKDEDGKRVTTPQNLKLLKYVMKSGILQGEDELAKVLRKYEANNKRTRTT